MAKSLIFAFIVSLSHGPVWAQYKVSKDMRLGLSDKSLNPLTKKRPKFSLKTDTNGFTGISGQTEASITGYVVIPNTYRLPLSARLSELIVAAEGILPQGSKRKIEIRRRTKKTLVVDLEQFEINGDREQNPYLQNGDIVYVPARLGTIKVVGAVYRSGEQEIVGSINIKEAIDRAGGFSVDVAKSVPVRIVRLEQKGKTTKMLSTLAEATKEFFLTPLENGDVVIIPSTILSETEVNYETVETPGVSIYLPKAERAVFMLGGFSRPGAYAYEPGLSLTHYVAMAGGLTVMGKPKKAFILRKEGGKNRINLDKPPVIYPGDAIVVPNKAFSPQFWPTFFLSIASFSLTVFLAVDNLRR